MKIVLKESQMKKVYDKFIDRLVDKTKIFEPEVLGDGWKYKYNFNITHGGYIGGVYVNR